jgi:predicted GTPase
MSNSSLQPDQDALRESAIAVITYVRDAMNEGVALLREHNRLLVENQGEHRLESEIQAINENLRHVNDNLERVKRSELTMTIVAPTSAGKSTIINAIAGQDLLPSRNDAMTVLPTEIVFSREVTRPKLTLGKALITLLREAWRQLHQKLQRIGLDEAIKQATKNDFLRENLIREIFNSSVFPLSEDVKSDDIQPALIKINELLRLCGIFGISTEFLSSLSEIPRIEVPFPPLLSPLKDSSLGTLALVDTPGPNEDKSLNLVNVVEDRLGVSSLVLVVVDYRTITDPENQKEVKELVDKMAKIKGRDRIYIIVNKIDARDPNNDKDLTAEEILNLVKTKYEIDDPQNRVFEMSAVEAFLATNFQREEKICSPTELRKSNSFEALGQKYYAKSWRTQKTTVTLEEMQKAADVCLQDSGFVGFIDKAITPLVPTMITIKGSLNDISQRFASFLFCLSKQKGILERDIQRLGIEINQLQIDLSEAVKIYDNDRWKQEIAPIGMKVLSDKKAEAYPHAYKLSNNIENQLDSLNGRVFARLKTEFRMEWRNWSYSFYEIDLNVMRDTYRLIAEEAIENLEFQLIPSFLLGENFKKIIHEIMNSYNLIRTSYHDNIFLKAQKKTGKSFQFNFIPDLLTIYFEEVIIVAYSNEDTASYGANYHSYDRIIPNIDPKIESISQWLSSELNLKVSGHRLDSNEISDNLLEISKELRLKLKPETNKSIEELIEKCREFRKLPEYLPEGTKMVSLEARIEQFIESYTVADSNSNEYKISKKSFKNRLFSRFNSSSYDFNCVLRFGFRDTSYSSVFFQKYNNDFQEKSIFRLIYGQVELYLKNVEKNYCKKFDEEKKCFLTEYRESIIYSISELKETVNKYSSIKNECIRLSEIGTDLQSSIKHQQEYFKQH